MVIYMMNQNRNDIIRQYQEIKLYYKDRSFLHPSYHLERQLIDAIISGNEKRAKSMLDKINSMERAHLSEDSIRSFKNSLICTCTLFTRAVIKAGVDYEQAFDLSDACIKHIESTSMHNQLFQFEYDMLSEFINLLDKNKYSDVIQKVMNFIQNNIFKQLTLDEIAHHVYLSPNYLSSKFKLEVNISLNSYINKTKIEESKYLLHHTNTSISDIVFLFNFCNQSYYCSLFKKYNGITPKEYIKIRDKMES